MHKITKKIIFFAFVAILLGFTQTASAGIEVSNGLTLFGDTRFRYETDTDTAKNKNRDRQRIRLRFGAKYVASENATMGFRLTTGTNSLQSPHTTLELANPEKNTDLGIDWVYLDLHKGPVKLLLGKWKSPLFNPSEFIHDEDIALEGIGLIVGGDLAGIHTDLVATQIMIKDLGWSDSDDTLTALQAIVSGGGSDVTFKAAVGADIFQMKSLAPETDQSITHAVAEIRAKNIYDLRIGAGYALYTGEGDYTNADKAGYMLYARAKFGSVGLRLYYFDMGYASQPLFGAMAQDTAPFSSNFKGPWVRIDMPKILNAVTWDIRYFVQSTKNENLSFADGTPGYVLAGADRTRTRLQVNFNMSF